MSTPEHEPPTSPPPGAPPPAAAQGQPQPYGFPSPAGPGQQGYGPGAGSGSPVPPMPGPPPWGQYSSPDGALGTMRPTGMTILLFFVTFGIWGFVYIFQTQEEMKRHTGEGLGGIAALVVAVIFGAVSPFLLSNEVGKLYERRGQAPPVTALTALWFVPGILILVGPFVWFVQTNKALNEYWRSLGATRTSLT